MVATTRPVSLIASNLMNREVVTIAQDAPFRRAAGLFFRRQIAEAVVVDADGRCVGVLSAPQLLSWVLEEARGGVEEVPEPACPYQTMGRLLTGGDAVICTRAPGSCPLQEVRPMSGGRHTTVCLLQGGLVSDWQQVSEDRPAPTVRHHMTANVPTVQADTPLSVLVRTVLETHAASLIVVDEQRRPVGSVTCPQVLAALVRSREP